MTDDEQEGTEVLAPATAEYLVRLPDRWTLVSHADESRAVALETFGFAKLERRRAAGGVHRWHAKRTHQGRTAIGLPPLN